MWDMEEQDSKEEDRKYFYYVYNIFLINFF